MTTHQQTGSIQFLMGDSTEVLRISRDGITANPDVPVDEIAARVLELLEQNIRVLVQRAVEAEREACAHVCDKRAIEDSWEGCYADQCAADIRARSNP
jgi:hypothetical protein